MHLETFCPVFGGSTTPEQGPREPKQGSFGFKVYIYMYMRGHQTILFVVVVVVVVLLLLLLLIVSTIIAVTMVIRI